jgi:hypothetical protein
MRISPEFWLNRQSLDLKIAYLVAMVEREFFKSAFAKTIDSLAILFLFE